MRRRGIRRGNRSGGSASRELASLEYYLARNLFSWMRPDYRTEAAGNVTALLDKVALVSEGAVAANARSVDPAHAYAQAASAKQAPAVTTSGSFGGREVLNLTGGVRYYDSTLPSSSWKFTSDGSLWELTTVFSHHVTSGSVAWGTRFGASNSEVGITAYHTTQVIVAVNNGTATAVASLGPSGALSVDGPTYTSFGYDGSVIALRQKTAVIASAAPVGSFSSSNPDGTFRIGAGVTPTLAGQVTIADMLIAKANNSAMRTAAQRYIALRYPTI